MADIINDAQERPTTMTPPPTFEPPPPPMPPRPPADRSGRGGWRPIAAAALVAAVVSAGVTVPLTRALDEGRAPVPAAEERSADRAAPEAVVPASETGALTVVEVADRILPTVAQVDVAVGSLGQGSGSAVIFREDGYLLTNNHVVAGVREVRVVLPDGIDREAEVVGTDPSTDLAVLKVDADNLPVPEFADERPEIGSTAIAVGSPFGFQGTLTTGVVSAIGREIPTDQGMPIETIQTDAAINPGNSGGPLVNARAEIIGINTAIFSPSQASAGIGFAIPITTALPIAEQIIDQGFVEHAFLGVNGQDIDPATAELYGLPEQGAIIQSVVPDSAATEAGLQRGDIITAVNGERIDSFNDLAVRIRALQPGDTITLTIVRDREEREDVTVTLGTTPRNAQ